MRIVADERGAYTPTVAQRNIDLAAAVHDVAIGERKSVGGEDKARAAAGAGRLPSPGRRTDVDLDNRAGDALDRAGDRPRIGVEKRVVPVGLGRFRSREKSKRTGHAGNTSF